MNDILFLPVKPKWAKLIMSGQKTLELRKRLPLRGFGNPCLIYSSSPRCEALGTCNLTQGFLIATHEPTLTCLSRASITAAEFRAYAGEADRLFGLELLAPKIFAKPVPLETLRLVWGIEPPQQWRYVDRETFDQIVRAGK